MKKHLILISLLLFGLLCVAAVSAETIDSGTVYFDNVEKVTKTYPSTTAYYMNSSLLGFNILKADPLPDSMYAYYIGIKAGNGYDSLNISKNIQRSGDLYWMDGATKRVVGTANVKIIGLETVDYTYYNSLIIIEITSWNTDIVSVMPDTKVNIYFDDGGYFFSQGVQNIAGTSQTNIYSQISVEGRRCAPVYNSGREGYGITNYNNIVYVEYVILSSSIPNHIEVSLTRIPVYLGKTTQVCYFNTYNETDDLVLGPIQIVDSIYTIISDISRCEIESMSGNKQTFYDSISEVSPTSGTLNIYIHDSQTNNLISGARVVIEGGFYDPPELLEVINETLPAGQKSYTLQPTGGGLPNPDYYRITVTADGYVPEMPYINTDLDTGMSMSIYMYMDPTGGSPENPENTFIDFYVRDLEAYAIQGATVVFDGTTLQTNNAGYCLFEVAKNSTYSYTVSKTGYLSLSGTVTIGGDGRYTVNTVIVRGAFPTPTPYTPAPVTPTPTPTAGAGFLEQSGKAMADLFGVSLTVGKLILGMLLALAIGMTTAKQLHGGANEFGMGLLGGAMLGVVIGLIPVWVIVVLLLVVGMYIGSRYVGGSGGQ